MSENEENNIDKIFNEMMSSNSMEEITVEEDVHQIVKEMLHVQESLAESVLNVNSIIYYLIRDSSYRIPESVSDLVGALFKISEDFLSHILEINGTIEAEDYVEEEDGDGEE